MTLWYRPPEILLGSQTYAPPVDVWAVGCILVEMVTKRPMFPGECEIDELYKIFRVFGTPNDDVWEGVTGLQDYNKDFPQWPRLNINNFCKGLCDPGIDLLERMMKYAPSQRISARAALTHPFFDDLDKDAI